jgi:hypothetical protein
VVHMLSVEQAQVTEHAKVGDVEFPRFRGHLSAWPVWVGLEDGVHVRAEALHEAVSGGVSA